MINYSTIANTTGSFPSVVSNNVTSPGAGDGTPYTKAVIDDLWGFSQAIMNYGGVSPTGVTESYSNSQRLNALIYTLSPPGTIVGWHSQQGPLTYNARLLVLTGQGVLRSSYTDLDAICYVGNSLNPTADAYYHADDAAGTIRNIAGIYLILPDLRGCTLRGWDPTATRDPQGDTRIFPDFQAHSTQKHYHQVFMNPPSSKDGMSDPVALEGKDGGGAGSYNLLHINTGVSSSPVYTNDSLLSNGGDISGAYQNNDEVRMDNFQVKWCVRY